MFPINIEQQSSNQNEIKYGGIFSYSIEYELNEEGTWNEFSSQNPSTSYLISVPKETLTIQIRVYAIDNLGYESTTPITSNLFYLKPLQTKIRCSHINYILLIKIH